MRTYGRVSGVWTEVDTDTNGFNDLVWLVTLIQCLQLNLGESPFWANYGIPAQVSVITQVFPDFYMARTQQQFSSYFASLIISKQTSPTPTYKVDVITNQGFKLTVTVPT